MVARVFAHRSLEELVEFGSIPVVNALSDLTHPCQILADFFTIKEFRGSLEDLITTEEETAEVLEQALYNLWSIVNDLAKIKPKHDRFRATIFG